MLQTTIAAIVALELWALYTHQTAVEMLRNLSIEILAVNSANIPITSL